MAAFETYLVGQTAADYSVGPVLRPAVGPVFSATRAARASAAATAPNSAAAGRAEAGAESTEQPCDVLRPGHNPYRPGRRTLAVKLWFVARAGRYDEGRVAAAHVEAERWIDVGHQGRIAGDP